MSEHILNFHDVILVVTAYLCLLFVLIIISKRERHISDYFIIGFFVAQTAIPLHILINYSNGISITAFELSPILFRFFDIAFWIESPLLLWYTRSLLYKDFSFKRKDLWFFLPMLFYILYISSTYYSVDLNTKINFLEQAKTVTAPSTHHTVTVVRESISLLFGLLCLYEINHARNQIKNHQSSIESINFNWLGLLTGAYVFAWALALVFALTTIFKPEMDVSFYNLLGLTGNYLRLFLISALILFSITRSRLFRGSVSKENKPSKEKDFKVDESLVTKLEKHMQEQKPYLAHMLNLDQLAKQLNIPTRTLSKTINGHYQTNFYEFINSFRIEKAKTILQDREQDNKKMIEILNECGFNSKATFNSFFKKNIGTTPTQYRKEQIQNS